MVTSSAPVRGVSARWQGGSHVVANGGHLCYLQDENVGALVYLLAVSGVRVWCGHR